MESPSPIIKTVIAVGLIAGTSALGCGASEEDAPPLGGEAATAGTGGAGESGSGGTGESGSGGTGESGAGGTGESGAGGTGESGSGGGGTGGTGTSGTGGTGGNGNIGPGLEGTTLKQIADDMEEGTFFYLENGSNDPALPDGFDSYSSVQMTGTFYSSSDAWSPVAEWCPILRRVYQVLDRSGNTIEYDRTAISGYDANTHAWIRHKLHPDSETEKILGSAHVYGGWAVASEQGKLYRPMGTTMWEYDLPQETWASRDWPGFGVAGQTPVVYHPDIDRLVAISGSGEVLAWDPAENTVETLAGGNPAQSGRHGHAVYNALRQEVMLWAGDNGRQVTLVQANKTAVAKDSTPSEAHEGSGNSGLFLSYDPLSGNYLSFDAGNKHLWEYNPVLDEWRFVMDLSTGPDRFPPYHGHLMTPIPEAGVVMWNHRTSPRLYKHKSVF